MKKVLVLILALTAQSVSWATCKDDRIAAIKNAQASCSPTGNQRIFSKNGKCSPNMSSVGEAALIGATTGLASGALGKGIGGAIGLTEHGEGVIGLPLSIFGLNATNGIPEN